jgi:magnesium transporter
MKTPRKKKSAGKLGKAGAHNKAGLPPGSLIHIGHVKTEKTSFDLIKADANSFEILKDITLDQILNQLDTTKTNWIRVIGLQNATLIGEFGEKFKLHPLFLEDVLNTGQRPKLIIEEDALFFTLKTLAVDKENAIIADQVSFVLKENLLISFHESDLSIFDTIFKRFEVPAGKLRTYGPDYLLYALTDIIVDHYFQVVEIVANALDQIEEKLITEMNEQVLDQIQHNRKELIFMKKAVFPLREALSAIPKTESDLLNSRNMKYFNDVNDHVMQIFETIENYRELNTSLKDMYLSELSHRMNKVMQVLTIIATIFIPLTFIAGIYGMNFEYMPELSFKYGYFVVWFIMLFIAAWMLVLFRKNKWL